MTVIDDLEEPPVEETPRRPQMPRWQFANHIQFFEKWFARTFRRDLANEARYSWCPEWWRHGEAVEAMKALHESWEDHHRKLIPSGNGPAPTESKRAEWMIYICYPLLNRLLDPEGVFAGCDHRSGHDARSKVLPMTHDPSGKYLLD